MTSSTSANNNNNNSNNNNNNSNSNNNNNNNVAAQGNAASTALLSHAGAAAIWSSLSHSTRDAMGVVRVNLTERRRAVAERSAPLVVAAALFCIVLTGIVLRTFISVKYGYFRDVVDVNEFDAARRSLLRDEPPRNALVLYAMIFNNFLVLFGLALPPDVLVAALTPITTVVVGCSTAFLLGRIAKDTLAGLIAAALFAMTPALVQPTTAGFFNHHVIGLPLAMLAVLFFAMALRRRASPPRPRPQAPGSFAAAATRWLPRIVHAFSVLGGVAAIFAVCAQHSWSYGIWLPQIVATHTAVLLGLGVRGVIGDGVFESFVAVYAAMCGWWTFRLTLENVPLLLVCVWALVERAVPRLRLHAPLLFAVWCAAPLVAHLSGALALDAPASGTLARNGLGWLALFRDFHVPLFAVPAGLQYCLSQATSVTLFFAVYAGVALLLVSGSESMTLFAAPALCVVAAVGISAVARGYMLPQDAAFRRRPRAVSKESVTSIVLFLLLMTTFFVVYALTSAMHRVVLRPSIAVHAVPTNDEALEMVTWVRANTNRTASILAYPDSDSFKMVLASDRRFHVSNLNPGAMPRNPSNTYADEAEYFRTRRGGDAFDAATVLLSPEDTAWSVMRELGGAYLLVRCSPFDTSEYSMHYEVLDEPSGVDGSLDAASAAAVTAATIALPRANMSPSHLTAPQLRFAQLAVDSRLLDHMRAALLKDYVAEAVVGAGSGGGLLSADTTHLVPPVRAPAVTLAAHTLIQNQKLQASSAAAAAAGGGATNGGGDAASPPPLLSVLCSARSVHFRAVFASLRGQFRLFRSKMK